MVITALTVACSLAAGVAQTSHTVAPELRVSSGDTETLAFDLPKIAAGLQVRLSLDARVDWPGLAGSNPWLIVATNGRNALRDDLLNKPFEFTMRCGMDTTWAYGPSWRIVYSPDFSETLRTAPIPFGIPDVDPYRFVWDITPHVSPGQNELAFTHPTLLAEGTVLVLRDVTIEVGDPAEPAATAGIAPAPDGPLPTHVPERPRRVPMRAELSAGGSLRVSAAGRTQEFACRISEPDGAWLETSSERWREVKRKAPTRVEWEGTGYRVTRTVRTRSDHVRVADTITNTTGQTVGLIYENSLALAEPPKEMRLGGHEAYSESQEAWSATHPTALAVWDDLALGMVAEDDVYRAHSLAFRRGDTIGVSDPQLGIAAGASHTLEWSVYPVPDGDYWDFINAVRRNWGSNITLPGPMTFEQTPDGKASVEEYRDWVDRRGLGVVLSGQTAFEPRKVAEGTGLLLAREWCEGAANWTRKLEAGGTGVRPLIYLHAQICTEPGAEELYADSHLLDAAGEHLTSPYYYPVYLYVPTLENSYGKALKAAVPEILEELGADGFYLDEMEWASAQYAYGTAWDGATAIVDATTHALTGTCSSVVLLQQPWKQWLVKYLRDRDMMIVGNSQPMTRAMLDLGVPRFVETASYSFLVATHLATPMGLGNHDNVGGDKGRAEMARRMLDHAGLLVIYTWEDEPEGTHFGQLMFPTTPIELREGMVLGEERIVTNRSGRYGWGDASQVDVYVFDGDGRLVEGAEVERVIGKGRTLTEVRMPSDHFAILVRR